MRIQKKKGSKAKRKPLPIEINLDEFTAIMKATMKMHHKIAFLLAWGSGLRISEVVGLKPEDFNFEEKTIRVNMGKNSKDRIVPIPKCFEKRHLKYIPIKCGTRALQKALVWYADKSGVLAKKPKAHFHSLRHGFATQCVSNGMPIHHIRTLMGHSNISTTNVYLEANPVNALKSYEELF